MTSRKKRELTAAELAKISARQNAARARALKREERAVARSKKRELSKAKRAAIFAAAAKKLKNPPAGFCYINHGLVSRIELTAYGDGTVIAAKLAAAGLRAENLTCERGVTRFEARKKDLDKIIAILREMCYNFEVGRSYGLVRLCAFAAARLGLVVGAAAAVLLTNLAYSYVWRIDVSGCENVPTAAVESALKAAGIAPGAKKRSMTPAAVTAAVNTLDGIADCSAEMTGTTLYVYVLEAERFATKTEYAAYRAAFDATVTRVVMRDGTATVKRGDVVKAGDMLADGSVYSTAGELMYSGACDGEIYGNVALTFSVKLASVELVPEKTGREVVKTGVRLFGKELFDVGAPFELYESSAATVNYDVLLPLYVTHYRYAELALSERERDIDGAAQAFAAQKAEELRFTSNGEFSSSYTVKPFSAGLYDVHVFLSGEALISQGVR